MAKKMLRLGFDNWDDFDPEMVVTNHEAVSKSVFTDDGVFSPRIFGKLDSNAIQYSCKCGELQGKFYEGRKCETCNEVVAFTKPIIERRAWIDLGDYYLMNPLFFKMMSERIFPKGALADILDYDIKINLDGVEDEAEVEPKFKYTHTGIIKFKENFDEIVDHYYALSNSIHKERVYNFVKKNKKHIFTNKIPVFSTSLRPGLLVNQRLIFDDINNLFNEIIHNSEMLKNFTEIERKDISTLPLLYKTQVAYNNLYDHILSMVQGKKGFIRQSVLGARVDFSARNVITPLPPGYYINEIVLPYKTCIELFKPMIINILTTVKGINHNKASTIWHLARTKHHKMIYDIMLDIINREDGIYVLFNRNPTLAYGGILRLKVVDIKADITSLTASCHNGILALIGGDYDGDTLNIILLNDIRFVETFEIFDPHHMWVSGENGKFNSRLNIERDQVLGLATFNM